MERYLQYVAELNDHDAMRELRNDIDFLTYLCESALTKLRIQGNPVADLVELIGRIEELKRNIDERLSQMHDREYFEEKYTDAMAKYNELKGVLDDENGHPNDPQPIANEDPARGGRRIKTRKTKRGTKTKRSRISKKSKKTKGRKY
jgi:hypothetical protein